MWTPDAEIEKCAKEVGVTAKPLDHDEKTRLKLNVAHRFATDDSAGRRLFERMKDAIGTDRSDAWRWLPELFDNSEILVFFEEEDSAGAFIFNDPSDLVQVLERCAMFTVYVSDKKNRSLVAISNESTLVVAGAATVKLNKLLEE
jgi:hypothetical protein